MVDSPFNSDWDFQRSPKHGWEQISLPHDAMIGETRRADAPSTAHEAYFEGGLYRYRKTLSIGNELRGKQISLFFEGVYRKSRILVNGTEAGGEIDGYAEFAVRIDPYLRFGEENLIEVIVDNSELPNSRWYTGSGIYRPVWLRVLEDIHILHDGLFFRTVAIGEVSKATIDVSVANPAGAELGLTAQLIDAAGQTHRVHTRFTGTTGRIDLDIPNARLWSPDLPNLYECEVAILRDGVIVDQRQIRVGLRIIEVCGKKGLRINGQPVLLRGANVHHDNGILGAATFAQAEYRRVRILKQNGFNAIRSAHNPASRAMIEACDELGMFMMDELFDGWFYAKTKYDTANDFPDLWPRTLASMVAKDRNHPSVILYSVGNENTEMNTAYGHRTTARIAQAVRDLDPSRAVTIGVNTAIALMGWKADPKDDPNERPKARGTIDVNSTLFNAVINRFVPLMKHIARLSRADRVTKPIFSHFDVAGYNYSTTRYRHDSAKYPDRVIIGTETFTSDVVQTWGLVKELPNVVGDFLWAGWEYLGEAGLGTWEYGPGSPRLMKPFPHLVSNSGMIDITGLPDTSMYVAQAAWGLLSAPVISVRPPHVASLKLRKAVFRSTDAVPSWSWRGAEGKPAHFEVVCAAEEVELIVGGRSLGRRPSGRAEGHVARWKSTYQPGEVVAIAYSKGREVARSVLHTARQPGLVLTVEPYEAARGEDELRFVTVHIADANGTVEMCADETITVRLDGAGQLAGFGSGAPSTAESFVDSHHSTYRGRALLAVRKTGPNGSVRIHAHSQTHGTVSVTTDDWH